jgi:hypothetical protein
MESKICPVCKKYFLPIKNAQKYCSKNCSAKIIKEYLKEYRLTNINKIKKYKTEYRKIHKESIREYDLKYRENKNRYRRTNRVNLALYMKKYRNILKNKVKSNLRYRCWSVLKGISKSESTLKLLGCSLNHLIKHLESKFNSGMSWKNYGYYGWHIDHIKPCASFDLSKPSEQRKCFHYSNLQPLWAKDNLSKNDKVI